MKIIEPTGLEVAMKGPFKEGYKVSQRQNDLRNMVSSPLDSVVRLYEAFLNQEMINKYHLLDSWKMIVELRKIGDQLSQNDLNHFLQLLACFENHPRYNDYTGFFITKLLLNSYRATQQGLILDFSGVKPVDYIGSMINDIVEHEQRRDLKQYPLLLTVNGTIGSFVFSRESSFFKATVRKAGPYSFCGIHDAEVNVHDAEGPETFFRDIIDGFGDNVITYNIQIRTPNPALIEPFQRNISKVKNGALYFIDPQGNDERVV